MSEMFDNDPTVTEAEKNNDVTQVEIRSGKYASPQLIPSSVRPLYGRVTKGKMTPIRDITYDTGRATVWGDVFAAETKVTKSGDKNIINFDITDYTGSITVKVFNDIKSCAVLSDIKKGSTIVVSGDVEFDRYAGDVVINARSVSTAKKVKTVDNADKKRVELHLHTNMSQMDAVTDAGSLVRRAAEFGHKAIFSGSRHIAYVSPTTITIVTTTTNHHIRVNINRIDRIRHADEVIPVQ